MFAIQSSSSSCELRFLSRRQDHFTVQLHGDRLDAVVEVYAFTDTSGLVEYFQGLKAHHLPWVGKVEWRSLEGEFAFGASCSTSGHVLFNVDLASPVGGPQRWSVAADVMSELGQLPALAAGIQTFFADEHA